MKLASSKKGQRKMPIVEEQTKRTERSEDERRNCLFHFP